MFLRINSWKEAVAILLDMVMSVFNIMNCCSFSATVKETRITRADNGGGKTWVFGDILEHEINPEVILSWDFLL